MLCKIMINQADDLGSLISSQAGLKYMDGCACRHSFSFFVCLDIVKGIAKISNVPVRRHLRLPPPDSCNHQRRNRGRHWEEFSMLVGVLMSMMGGVTVRLHLHA